MPWIVVAGKLPWLGIIFQLAGAFLVAVVAHWITTRILQRITAPFPYSRRLVAYTHRLGAALVFLLVTQVIMRSADDALPGIVGARHANAPGLPGRVPLSRS